MATSSVSFEWWNTNDAMFRAWGLAIHTQLLAVGLTVTADATPIDFSTVLKPGALNTYMGWKMYNLSGGFKLKVEFGSGANLSAGGGASAVFPGITFQVGTGTDGAGNLTGNVSTKFRLEPGGGTLGVQTHYFSGSGGDTLAIALLPDQLNNGACITFGRSRNSSGVLTTEYLHICAMGLFSDNGSSTNTRVSKATQIVYSAASGGCLPAAGKIDSDFYSVYPVTGAGVTFATNVGTRSGLTSRTASGPKGLGVQPIFPFAGYPDNWCQDVAYYFTNDVPGGTTIPLNVYGTQRNFLCLGLLANNSSNAASNASMSLAIPWY